MGNSSYQALVAEERDNEITLSLQGKTSRTLQTGEVAIHVQYSSLNYKDALAAVKGSQVVSSYPIVPGIDLAGTVTESKDSRYREGECVLVTGYGLGVSHDGGLSEQAFVPGDWIVPLPDGMSLEEAMVIGTAGFTAALSIDKLEASGLQPGRGPVLVTGASGGVGSMAVAMLAKLGYEVTAVTGKEEAHVYLQELGAADVIPRERLVEEEHKPLLQQKWSGAIDPVGGEPLSYILSTLQYGGAVANCGLTAGVQVNTSVFPFILRGIQLIGIDSVHCPMDVRLKIWKRLATDLKLPADVLERIKQPVRLQEVPDYIAKLLQGSVHGRTLVVL